MMRTPCGVFLYSYIPGEIWMGCLPVYFRYYFVFGVGGEGKFFFCFSSVSKFQGCITENNNK